jgi:hypothetical protein
VLETLAWMNNTVHPTFTHVFMPYKFAGTPETQEELKSFNAKVYAGLLGELEALAKKAADAGRAWLGGEKLGPLDVYALTLLRWGGFAKIDPTGYATLWAHVQKVAQQPGVARAIERERLQLNLFQGLTQAACAARHLRGGAARTAPACPAGSAPHGRPPARCSPGAGGRSPARWAGPGPIRPRWCPGRGRRAGTPARVRLPECRGRSPRPAAPAPGRTGRPEPAP